MAISTRLKAFLETSNVRYTVQKHPTVYTAQEIAAAQHVSGRHLAKCVFLKTEKGFFLTVLPATHRVDFGKLKSLLGVKKISLASEGDIKQTFPDIDVGAMSAFGHLYNVPTLIDKALAAAEEIVCNAGTHTDTVSLRYADFVRLAKPKVRSFGLEVTARASSKSRAKRPIRKTSKKPPTRARKKPTRRRR